MSQIDKDLNDALSGMIRGIGRLFYLAGRGVRRLNRLQNIISFLVTIIIAALSYFNHDFVLRQLQSWLGLTEITKKVAYIFLLLLPFVFLVFVGGVSVSKEKKYDKEFEKVGFKSRQGKYPILISERTDQLKQQVYLFRSDITISQWERSKPDIEMALEGTINSISNANSKRIVQVVAIPSSFCLPGDRPGDEPLYWSDDYVSDREGEVVLGISYRGQIKIDLNDSPHVLSAGETGSGKSVILRCCLWQLIQQGARVIMIDFKGGVEFGIDYEQYGEVITDRKRAAEVLKDVVEEMKHRLEELRQARVKKLPEYNRISDQKLCRIAIFCDEIGEMLDKKGKSKEEKVLYEELESYISSISRMGRAPGINLFLGVQRPDANIITGQIKANVPVRICGRFTDKVSSEIVLGSSAATCLPAIKGRFVFSLGNAPISMQSYLFEDKKVMNGTSSKEKKKTDTRQKKQPAKKKESKETPFYELPPIYAREEEEGETGFEYQVQDFNYDFNDEKIEWSVDNDERN